MRLPIFCCVISKLVSKRRKHYWTARNGVQNVCAPLPEEKSPKLIPLYTLHMQCFDQEILGWQVESVGMKDLGVEICCQMEN